MIVELQYSDTKIMGKLDLMPIAARDALSKAVTINAMELTAYVKEKKLSGQVLQVRTGNLRRSIHATPTVETPVSVQAAVKSSGDVKYAGIHEFGGVTAPHDIYPVHASALRFMGRNGQFVFAKVVHHPGSRMPERSFLRSGLKDLRPKIVEDLKAAARNGYGSL